MARQFNVDAGALLEEQSAQLANAMRENMILRHQLADAEKQIDALEGKDEHVHEGEVEDPKPSVKRRS